MRRLAFFVEGSSEVLFVERLIREIAGKNNVTIQTGFIKGGKKVPKQVVILNGENQTNITKYYVLIFNCQGDNQVITRMCEEHEELKKHGYYKIIGLRDVRPDFSYDQIPQLQRGMNRTLAGLSTPSEIILSAMEIESVFLGETSHFEKISPAITIQKIIEQLKFNPVNDDMEKRTEPATDLNNCYQLGKQEYTKDISVIERTVNSLDFNSIYLELPKKYNSISRLVSNIDDFLTP